MPLREKGVLNDRAGMIGIKLRLSLGTIADYSYLFIKAALLASDEQETLFIRFELCPHFEVRW